MGVLAGAAIAGPVLGGLVGMQTSAANRQAAQDAANAAYAEIQQMGAPPNQQAAIILKHFQSAGLYTPQLEQQINAGISQASQTNTDTLGRQAQVGALGQIQSRANTGYNAQDRAALNQMMQQAGAAEQGQLGAIKQGMASRGMAGSGADLASQLQAASASGNQMSNNSLNQAAQSQQAALQAAVQSGQMGGQLSASDFAQAQAKAQAADRFKMFDTQNQIAQQQRNVGAQNQGQLYNLTNNQQLQNANTQMDNAEQMRQLAAQQQYWQEQNMLAQEKANARLGQASNLNQQANATAGQYAGIGAGMGAGAGAALNYYGKQKPNNNDEYEEDTSGSTGTGETATGGLNEGGMGYQASANGGYVGYDKIIHRPDNYAAGGMVNPPRPTFPFPSDQIHFQIPQCYDNGGSVQMADKMTGANLAYGGFSPGYAGFANGGEAQSPIHKILMDHAGKVPGKANVPGDSLQNDKVSALLSPGELIIPRTVAEQGPAAAYGFVHAIMKHKDGK